MKNTKSKDSEAEHPSPSRSGAPQLRLTVQYATHGEGIPTRPMFRKWVKAALTQDAEIVLRVVDEPEGHTLNQSFRGKDYATNVLTFNYGHDYRVDYPAPRPLSGDIVLCAPVIEHEARQQGKNLDAHYAHLTIHGVLHLQGHEHGEDVEAEAMEQLEVEILGRLGYEDPYRETRTDSSKIHDSLG
ncbi:MAG TPA: rRNA maturation RNase YbeY [Nitrosospira sp.]|nr:rRNA maturation RNase YbeY [Nitrosospira sp.]